MGEKKKKEKDIVECRVMEENSNVVDKEERMVVCEDKQLKRKRYLVRRDSNKDHRRQIF